jgi:hypothetical protein
MVTYKGIARGKTIELEEPLPFPIGEPITVSVEPLAEELRPGSPAAILKVLREPPHLTSEDVDELERAIESGKLPVRHEGIFDEKE